MGGSWLRQVGRREKESAKPKKVQLLCSWCSKPSVLRRHGFHSRRIKILLRQEPAAQRGRNGNHADLSPLSVAHWQNSVGGSGPSQRGLSVEMGVGGDHTYPVLSLPCCQPPRRSGQSLPSLCKSPAGFFALEAGSHGKVQTLPLPHFNISAIHGVNSNT